jgi:hypothetical protein
MMRAGCGVDVTSALVLPHFCRRAAVLLWYFSVKALKEAAQSSYCIKKLRSEQSQGPNMATAPNSSLQPQGLTEQPAQQQAGSQPKTKDSETPSQTQASTPRQITDFASI